MLRTDDRALLVDLLAPPEPGYRLERAVGTTFTTHLETLLRVPLAVVGAEWRDGADPLGVMEAVRSSADRIDLFCQAGMVSIPRTGNALLAFLEPIVHQVRRPRPGHLFHPKVWLASFTHPERERRFRMLCGSRNLTSDRAWDAIVALSGVETLTRSARNWPLSEFLASLSNRVPAGISKERARGVAELAEAVRFAAWEPPEGIDSETDWLAFHWIDNGQRFRGNLRATGRALVVSPFLNAKGLDTIWPGSPCAIVSRAESFEALGDEYLRELRDEWADELLELDDDAALVDEDEDLAAARWELRGLHAKVIVVERGYRSHVFVGSANATDAAWSGNTEFVVELVGPKKRFGVDAALADVEGGLRRVLHAFTGEANDEIDEEVELRRQLEQALVDLAALTWSARAHPAEDERWVERVVSQEPLPAEFPADAVLTARLLTTDDVLSLPAAGSADLTWHNLDPADITPFVALELTAGATGKQARAGCVVLARLKGAPEDRLDRLIARQVGSPEAFIRFLLLLLELGRGEQDVAVLLGEGQGAQAVSDRFGARGVLESLVTALADHPDSIDEIERLVERLAASDEGRAVLPPRWDDLWPQVLAARDQVR